MELKSTIQDGFGRVFDVFYYEQDPMTDLDGKVLQAVHAFCFCANRLVIAYSKAKDTWSPPGGGIESGETIDEAVVREVQEETNMRVLSQVYVGYQDIYESDRVVRQTRSFCVVEPIGDFIADPDGDITEIKLIDPKEYKHYFHWGVIGDRLMERVLELYESTKTSVS